METLVLGVFKNYFENLVPQDDEEEAKEDLTSCDSKGEINKEHK